MATTNFPDGVTNATLNSAFTDMMMPDPTLLHAYWNDFDVYTAGDWVVTLIGGAGTAALTAGNGGLLLITSDALDDDGVVLQKTPAGFAFTANKRCWFSCKFAASKATQSDIQVGLVIVDTTPLDATDGVYFQKDDGDANIDIICRKDATTGSNSKTAIGTLAAATQTALQFYYDGAGRIFYGINGALVGSMDASSTYLPDATNLTVSMCLKNGEAGAQTLTVDYIFAAMER